MSETTHKTTTRRDLMGAAGFTALAGIAAVVIAKPDNLSGMLPVAHDPDASLLALCARFLELQVEIDKTYDKEDEEYQLVKLDGRSNKRLGEMEKEHEVERDPWHAEQVTLLDEIAGLNATTLTGQRARARVLMAWYNLHRRGPDELGTAIEWHNLEPLFRDLLGEAV